MSSSVESVEVLVPNNPGLPAVLSGDPSSGNRNAYCLSPSRALKLVLGGSDHNVIVSIAFYPSSADEAAGTNGATISLTPDPPAGGALIRGTRVDGQVVNLATITWDAGRQWVTIGDVEQNSPMQPDSFWFKLQIFHDHNEHQWTFWLDPEIVNTGGGAGGWSPVSPSDPVTIRSVAMA